MSNPNRHTGRAKGKVSGGLMPTAGDTTVTFGGPVRTEKNGDYEVGGFIETTEAGKVEFTVLAKPSFDPIAFGRLDDETVDVEFDNGPHYVFRHAYAERAPGIGTKDGEYKCVMMGQPAEKVA